MPESSTFVPTLSALPEREKIFLLASDYSPSLKNLIAIVRPDVIILEDAASLGPEDKIIASGPYWASHLQKAREQGINNHAFLLPAMSSCYYDFWSFPSDLLKRNAEGQLTVHIGDFLKWLTSLGDFFGYQAGDQYVPDQIRYRPSMRAEAKSLESLEQLLKVLEDDESRRDLKAVFTAGPPELWGHWLQDVYNGVEYFDYVDLNPGDVVLNCGVHGGGEIPLFLAALKGQGTLVNIDPLGCDYLCEYVKTAMKACPVQFHEQRVALHDSMTFIDLPVENSGMAAGSYIDQEIKGLKTMRFRAATIDSIVENLKLDRVDLIKMDIEGAEPPALAGGIKTIKKCRPQLAISIYHAPEHFYGIPLALASVLESYKFFVRNYHFISNETILYAIPAERTIRPRFERINVKLAA